MKIVKLKIKNMFGISAYEADGKSVELAGKNGTGKTSVIDAIRYALTHKSDRKYVIKNGENDAEILIETDTGLMIDRKLRSGMADNTSVKQNGNTVGAPEAFLKSIFVPLQLNPMEFVAMTERDQNAALLDMIHYEWNLDTIKEWFGEIVPNVNYEQNILAVLNDIQKEGSYYYEMRHDVHKEIMAERSVVEDIGASLPVDYDGAKWENANIGDLYTKIERIRKENAEIDRAKSLISNHDQKIRGFQAEREVQLAALDREMSAEEKNIETELAQLEERIKALRDKKAGLSAKRTDKEKAIESDYKAAVAKFDTEVESYAELAKKEVTPVDDLVAEAESTEKMKSHVNEWRRMKLMQDEIEGLQEQHKALDAKIQRARDLPGEILAKADIPIDGLTVEDGTPLINGLPVSNLSEGEKLDLAVRVSIRNTEGLQIILLDGVEKLADAKRTQLYDTLKKHGVQFIAAHTTNDDELVVTEV